MRLWSLHPKYLDQKGLVALWREGLLAQAVLKNTTKGYRNHPQLERFRAQPSPVAAIAAYLHAVHAEAASRGYRFDVGRIAPGGTAPPIDVPQGQLDFEWRHLIAKLEARAPAWRASLGMPDPLAPHPLFRTVPGGVADWERP
ncbi:MAG: pyrimidine dimer DNA glycosylase/endonuclease V [Rhodospirillales bacterium]|nr:pyrimidine dimer DNA glycosylase/endonuclease V [Rhodospirillales bacterium]